MSSVIATTAESTAVALMLRPGAELLGWEEFCRTHPPFSIALDGYVESASRFDPAGPRLNLDHHADVDRLATRSTCAQMLVCIRQGLFDAFCDDSGHRATAYANDCDEDICLAWFLLKYPRLAQQAEHPRLDRLVQAVDVLDTTAGASLHLPPAALLREQAWIFEPYRQARLQGALDVQRPELHEAVVEAVVERIGRHLTGHGEQLALDTRYERIGGGAGWAMVRELGPQSRLGMLADGIRAYVSVRPRVDGAWSYAIGRASPFIAFDVPALLEALNEAEPAALGRWGGSNLVGGSPRASGSLLPPHEVATIVNGKLGELSRQRRTALTDAAPPPTSRRVDLARPLRLHPESLPGAFARERNVACLTAPSPPLST